MYLKEDATPKGHSLDNETLLDLVVNAIYFKDEYLISTMKKEFPDKDSLFNVFDQNTILSKLQSDKEISKEEAETFYNEFIDTQYDKGGKK